MVTETRPGSSVVPVPTTLNGHVECPPIVLVMTWAPTDAVDWLALVASEAATATP
jgi:hypothetical protein